MIRIIICEGITELALVYYLNEKINKSFSSRRFNETKDSLCEVSKNIYLYNVDGKDNLKKMVKKLEKYLIDKDVEKIGFIMDADDNFDAMKDNLEDKISKLKKAGIETEYSYYILPTNNGSTGMAEDLVMKGLKAQKLLKVIEEDIFPKLKKHPESNIKNNAKTKFMIFGATQNPHTSSPSFMLMRSRGLINLDDDIFLDLKKYINEIVE